MASQQDSIKPLSPEHDNNIAPSNKAGDVSSPIRNSDKPASDRADDDYESEEEWEDTPPSHLDYRGKQDRPNIGAGQNATDGGKKKPVK